MTPPRYPVVCIDFDHTLLDSDASEALAFEATMRGAGVADPAVRFPTFDRINTAMWAAVEAGEMAAGDVRLARFRQFVAEERITADPQHLADTYAHGLATCGELFPDALPALQALRATARLALVTNGVSDIQRTRIDRLGIAALFDAIVISSEVGVSKPGGAFFDVVFDALGSPDRSGVLMVGDSLTSDMRGGIDYGLDTCWFNPGGAATDLPVTYEIARLGDLPDIVLGV